MALGMPFSSYHIAYFDVKMSEIKDWIVGCIYRNKRIFFTLTNMSTKHEKISISHLKLGNKNCKECGPQFRGRENDTFLIEFKDIKSQKIPPVSHTRLLYWEDTSTHKHLKD